MKGHIIGYSSSSNAGVISCEDGSRYTFESVDWKGGGSIESGIFVDFEADGKNARSIFKAVRVVSSVNEPKRNITAGLLAIFLGYWGVHKFYLGFNGAGLVFLLVNTIGLLVTWMLFFIPNIVLGFISLAEGIIYLTMSQEDFEKKYVVNKKAWF